MDRAEIQQKIINSFFQFTEDYRERSTRRDARIILRMDIGDLYPFCEEKHLVELVKQRNEFVTQYTSLRNIFRKPSVRLYHNNTFREYIISQSDLLKKKEVVNDKSQIQSKEPDFIITLNPSKDKAKNKKRSRGISREL